MKVAIIGAGASGVMASIVASKKNEVTVFEKNSKPLKKLLLTGNGRCNLYNKVNTYDKYHSDNEELLRKFVKLDEVENYLQIFTDLGLLTINKNNYIYPLSEKAENVKALLLNEAIKNKVVFKTDTLVDYIKHENNKFLIENEYFDKVIITTGSKAFLKNDLSAGYKLALDFKHSITPLYPALTSLYTDTSYEKLWAGKRCHVSVSLFIDDCLIKKEEGELQFTKYGLSGICIFNLSRYVKESLSKGSKVYVSICFLDWDKARIKEYFDKFGKRTLSWICDGFMDYELANVLMKYSKINKDKTWNFLSESDKFNFIDAITNFKVEIKDTKDFSEAQVCRGGIKLEEINPDTLESKKVKGLYFAGEILDIDGDCGGYNLTWAFLSGKKAGELND